MEIFKYIVIKVGAKNVIKKKLIVKKKYQN